MKLTYRPLDLELARAFTISRSSKRVAMNVLVELEHEGIHGLGEAAPNEYYTQDQASALRALERMSKALNDVAPSDKGLSRRLAEQFPDQLAAVAAVDMALHDWQAKMDGLPLWRSLELKAQKALPTSYTIGIDTPAEMVRQVKKADGYSIYKLKVGSANDEAILEAVRAETDKPIRVDANAAWEVAEAIERIKVLSTFGLEFVEQPIAPGNSEDMRRVREAVEVPIVADESSVVPTDVEALVGCVDGINIKLAKCGGITSALEMAELAKQAAMKVMFGCMIESSIGISAAAQLAPLADYADLDGNLLLADDPASGVRVEQGRLVLPDKPGIGVSMKSEV